MSRIYETASLAVGPRQLQLRKSGVSVDTYLETVQRTLPGDVKELLKVSVNGQNIF